MRVFFDRSPFSYSTATGSQEELVEGKQTSSRKFLILQILCNAKYITCLDLHSEPTPLQW